MITNRHQLSRYGLAGEADTGNSDITLAELQAAAGQGDPVLPGQNYGADTSGASGTGTKPNYTLYAIIAGVALFLLAPKGK